MNPKNRFHVFGGIWKKPYMRIIVSLLILTILFVTLPIVEIWHALRKVSLHIWILILAAFLMGHIAGAVKWSLLVNSRDKILPLSLAFRYYFAGLFANLCLPSLVGGDVIRAGMAIRFNNDKESVILGGLLDRVLDLTALGIIILVGTAFSPVMLALKSRNILLILFLFILFCILFFAFLLFMPLFKSMPKFMHDAVIRIRYILDCLISKPQRIMTGFVIAILMQGGFVLLNMMLGSAIGIHLPVSVWFLAWPLAKLSAMIPVSMGGLGVREAALGALLVGFGVPFTSSVGLGLLWQTILIAGGVLGGIFYLLSGGRVQGFNIADAEPLHSERN